MYDPILARSFSKNDQKKIAAYAFLICLIVGLSLCSVFRAQFHFSVVNLNLSTGADQDTLVVGDSSVISEQLKVSETSIVSQNLQMQEGPALRHLTDNEREEIPTISKPLAMSQLPLPSQAVSFQERHAVVNPAEDIVPETSQQQESLVLGHPTETQGKDMKLICRVSEPLSDYCEIEGNIRIIGKYSSTILVPSSSDMIPPGNSSWRIKPYARKGNEAAMSTVREWTVKAVDEAHESIPSCTKTRTTPAILLSVGGFSGNYFHEFSDLLIPLFSNSRIFQGKVHFLATDYRGWWISKFQSVFDKLSDHKVIDIDREEGVQCYTRVIIGLKSHKELGIDKSKSANGYSIKDFRGFLRTTYSLQREKAIKFTRGNEKKPSLLIISRKRSQKILNEGKISKMAQSLGYEVVVAESSQSTNVSRFAEMVNSCDVLMGVHGAGLTNMLFLPDNAVVIQVVPLGGIEAYADIDFGEPSKDMDLRYMSYKIGVKESPLIQQYPLDHRVFKDPLSFHRQGWDAVKTMYLDNQDVMLDVRRFRSILSRALKLLHR